jgi:hypothetical protein
MLYKSDNVIIHKPNKGKTKIKSINGATEFITIIISYHILPYHLLIFLTKRGGRWANLNKNRKPYGLNFLYVTCLNTVDSPIAQASATFLHYALH